MKITLEVEVPEEMYAETIRGQLIQAGVDGMNSGALTGFKIAEGANGGMAAREAAAIRFAADHVAKVPLRGRNDELSLHDLSTRIEFTLRTLAHAVETGQVRTS